MKADLCIVATRRPELLIQMLDSFHQRVFPRFDIGKVIANIDPAFGDKSDELAAIDIIKARFPDATIFTPPQQGFASAVARVWAATTTEYVFHTEEDWLAIKDAGDFTAPFREYPNLAQSLLYMPFHNLRAGLKRRFRNRKLFGYPLPFFRTPVKHISTSPGLYSGEFVRAAAGMMDVRFDPEKQFGGGLNPALAQYAASFDSYIHSPDGGLVLADLGRDWLAQRGIKKKIVGGAVSWSDATA